MEKNKRVYYELRSRDTSVLYLLDEKEQRMGLTVLPTKLMKYFTTEGNWNIESLVQIKLVGDSYPHGYAEGMTMRNSDSTYVLKFSGQTVETNGDETCVTTVLKSSRVSVRHILTCKAGTEYFRINTELTCINDEPVTVEMISSFSLCDLSAAYPEERMNDLWFYRLLSRWSGEGKLTCDNLVDLHFEPSWLRMGVNDIRYGQVGSMPVRGYFPWGVLEDRKAGYFVGAQLYYNGSWQMELYEKDDKAAFSGGLADREFGHFTKKLMPGESFTTPAAVLAAATESLDEVSWRLVSAMEESLTDRGNPEDSLPVLFNEYCTTWGNPTEENIKKIADHIKGHGMDYLVIDSGWYSIGDGDWWSDQGDWETNRKRFPKGLRDTADYIRKAGMIPGIWFEFECLGERSRAYKELTDLQLKRDGIPISDAGKRFFDMKDERVTAYLDEKVIKLLNEEGFGYIKVDYNGNYGIGPDGEDGFGEELRKTVLASAGYFKRIREKVPGIVIENCASGGHRLEPLMMSVADMASFSDAHECVTIPLIAANLHRAILPRQSQIWAVLRASDDERRLVYSLVNGLLGRLCLSGDIYDLSEDAWRLVDEGIAFYKKCASVIKDGKSAIDVPMHMDYSHPEGHQTVFRKGIRTASGKAMLVVHRFLKENGTMEFKLPDDMCTYTLDSVFSEKNVTVFLKENSVVLENMGEMSAAAVLLNVLTK